MRNLLILPLVAFLFGCVNPSPKKVAYVTLATIGAAAESAQKAVSEARANGKVSDTDWKSVSVKRDKFNVAYTAACKAAAFDTNRPASDNLIAIKDELVALVDQITKAKK